MYPEEGKITSKSLKTLGNEDLRFKRTHRNYLSLGAEFTSPIANSCDSVAFTIALESRFVGFTDHLRTIVIEIGLS